jgi:hypothetical protein
MANKKIKKVTTTVTEEFIDEFSNEKTHIICILDRSGSMADIISDSIGGFNTFLKKQKELPDEATITVALFDDRYDILYDNVNIKKAKELTKLDWIPRGTTALYDAIGKTINTEKANFARLGNEAPAKVLVCVVTDGMENASREYKLENVKNLIKECEKNDWNFIYLAANQDAFAVGSSFGVSHHNTYTYTASGAGVVDMSNVMFSATANYRGMSKSSGNFKKMSKSLINQGNNNSEDESEDDIIITTTGTASNDANVNTTDKIKYTSSKT